VSDPSAVEEATFNPESAEQRRQEDWERQFPWWDTAVPQSGEPAFTGGGGYRGYGATREARFASRLVARQRHLGLLLVVFLFGLLVWLAYYDPSHRTPFLLCAFLVLAVSAGVNLYHQHKRRHWEHLGQTSIEPGYERRPLSSWALWTVLAIAVVAVISTVSGITAEHNRPKHVVGRFDPIGTANGRTLQSDATTITRRLASMSYDAKAVVHGTGLIIESTRPIPPVQLALATESGLFYFRSVMCFAPPPSAPGLPKGPLPACGSAYQASAANIRVTPNAGGVGYNSVNIEPDPAFTAFSSSSAPDDPGAMALLDPTPTGQGGLRCVCGPVTLVASGLIRTAQPVESYSGQWEVQFSMARNETTRLDQVAHAGFHQYVAVELDGEVLQAQLIEPGQGSFSSFSGQGQVLVSSWAQAKSVAVLLSNGPLAVPLERAP
jgi:hypothetical protein